jgi:beta-lactamase regulating signal transducer with metallopeptidase domain
MTPSYLARLMLLSSASFFLLHLLLAALVASTAPAAIRRAHTMRPQHAARLLFSLRLLPAALSTLVVAALCVPSYLRFEPRLAEEEVSIACVVFAFLGAGIWTTGIYRTLSALLRSALYLRRCGGRESIVAGEKVFVVKNSAVLALTGIVHPRLLISEVALNELSGDQLAIALRHEQAHRASRDNLKRLLILLAPPLFPRLRILEQTWAKCAEWAADDRAADGDAVRSTTLAAALVRVARLQSGFTLPLATSLVEADEDLSIRVNRLLSAGPGAEGDLRGQTLGLSAVLLFIAAISLNSGALHAVHELLERVYDLW